MMKKRGLWLFSTGSWRRITDEHVDTLKCDWKRYGLMPHDSTEEINTSITIRPQYF